MRLPNFYEQNLIPNWGIVIIADATVFVGNVIGFLNVPSFAFIPWCEQKVGSLSSYPCGSCSS